MNKGSLSGAIHNLYLSRDTFHCAEQNLWEECIFFKWFQKYIKGSITLQIPLWSANVYLNCTFHKGLETLAADKSWTASCMGHPSLLSIWSTTILISSKNRNNQKHSKLKMKILLYDETLKGSVRDSRKII